jgi:hypothetical protein
MQIKYLATNTSSTYNPYIFGNATQEWQDKEHDIKILFTPSPEYPSVGNTTQLIFSIQDLKTGSHIKNVTATVTVINNLTATIDTGAGCTCYYYSTGNSYPVPYTEPDSS